MFRVSGGMRGGNLAAATASSSGAPQVPRGRPGASGAFGAVVPMTQRMLWSTTLLGLMLYTLVITSYRVPIGKLAIVLGLVGIFTQKGGAIWPPYLRWMGLFTAWCVGMSQFATYREWVATGVQNLVIMTLVALMAVNAMRERSQVRTYMVFFLLCFVLFPMRGAISNYFFHSYAMGGRAVWIAMYNNPNDIGAMALLQISMATALIMSEPKGKLRLLAFMVAYLNVFLILMTQSRGVFVALVLFAAIAYSGQRRKISLAMRCIAGILLLAPLAPSSVWERLATMRHATSAESLERVDGAEGSARERYEIWQVAKAIIHDHPITGVGIGVYKPNHESYAWKTQFSPIARGGRDTHSLYLNVIAETGYPGFMLYVGMLLSLLIYSERTKRRCMRAGLPNAGREILLLQAGFLSFLGACIFGTLPYLQHWLLHMAVLYAVTDIHRRTVDAMPLPPGIPRERTWRMRGAIGKSGDAGAPRLGALGSGDDLPTTMRPA